MRALLGVVCTVVDPESERDFFKRFLFYNGKTVAVHPPLYNGRCCKRIRDWNLETITFVFSLVIENQH